MKQYITAPWKQMAMGAMDSRSSSRSDQRVQCEVKHVGSVDGFVKMYDALYSNATGLH